METSQGALASLLIFRRRRYKQQGKDLNLVACFDVALYESNFSESSKAEFLSLFAIVPLFVTELQYFLHHIESILDCCLFWHTFKNHIEAGKEDFRRFL